MTGGSGQSAGVSDLYFDRFSFACITSVMHVASRHLGESVVFTARR